MLTRDLAYENTVEQVAETMVPKMKGLLENIRRLLKDWGYKDISPVYDYTDEEYFFAFGAVRPATPEIQNEELAFEFQIRMIEQRVNEGDDQAFGVTFIFTILKQDGLLVLDFSPYNFTPQIWEPDLRNLDSVLDRWDLLADSLTEGDIISLIESEKPIVGR